MVKLFFYTICLILRAWSGLSASLARLLTERDIKVGLAAGDVNKLQPLADETGALVFAADASKPSDVEELFARVDSELEDPDVVVYNANSRVSGSLASVDSVLVGQAVAVTAFGAVLVAQQAAKQMEPKGLGAANSIRPRPLPEATRLERV